jgi:hypothetical protein
MPSDNERLLRALERIEAATARLAASSSRLDEMTALTKEGREHAEASARALGVTPQRRPRLEVLKGGDDA